MCVSLARPLSLDEGKVVCLLHCCPWPAAHTDAQERLVGSMNRGNTVPDLRKFQYQEAAKTAGRKAARYTNIVFLNMLKKPRSFLTSKQKAIVSWRTWLVWEHEPPTPFSGPGKHG